MPEDLTWPAEALGAARAAAPSDAGDLLWPSDAGLGAARAASAAALDALCARLAAEPALLGEACEFPAQAAELRACDAATLDALWGEPQAYAWTRAAWRRLAAALAVPDDGAARRELGRHLARFQALTLGLALRRAEDRRFARPLPCALPFALPGSRWSLEGAGTVEIDGLLGGRLVGRARGAPFALALRAEAAAPGAEPPLRECPVAEHDGYALRLLPAALHVEGLAVGEPALAAGLDYQARHTGLLSRALGHVARHVPGVFAGFRRAIRVAALKPAACGPYDDFSEPELPGSFVASAVAEPCVLADHLVHEFQHNRLSLVEEGGALFAGGEHAARCYSPWRDKPRGAYGILHGVYVFVGVFRYWLSVRRAGDAPPDVAAFAVDRLLRLPVQLRLALAVLREEARLTRRGRDVLARLAQDVEQVERDAAAAGLPEDAPAMALDPEGRPCPERAPPDGAGWSVRASLREHLHRNDPAGRWALRLGSGAAAAALRP